MITIRTKEQRKHLMKLQFLCDKHCLLVLDSPEQSKALWQGAYNHGVEAYSASRWNEALAFLGTAYEIGLLRFAVAVRKRDYCLSASQFGAVGRYYANLLCRLEKFSEAKDCLRRSHDGLLYWSQDTTLDYPERLAAFEQLSEFRQKLVALLRLNRNDEAQTRCLDLMAQQLAKQALASLCH